MGLDGFEFTALRIEIKNGIPVPVRARPSNKNLIECDGFDIANSYINEFFNIIQNSNCFVIFFKKNFTCI